MSICVLAGCKSPTPEHAAADTPVYYRLGGFHRAVDTGSPDAQLWFDRGLALSFAFNHEEAIRCFERALEADPGFAMAQWGVAYASGPNINNLEMDEAASRRAFEAVEAARRLVGDAEVERDLIEAMSRRYAWPAPADRSALNRAYAEAMREVRRKHPDDAEVTALFAESLMILRPWKHWSPQGEPAPETPEIVATLESGLSRWPDHLALCHFYIHTMEASPHPEKALAAADRLRDLAPGAGHLVHMPSHIDILVGQYQAAIEANRKGIAADEAYVEKAGRHNFYTLYRVHNYHFLVFAAMFDGQSELALEASRELVEQIPEDLLYEWSDFFDAFVPTTMHVLVRFGRWDDILAEPLPRENLPVTAAVWHYARGLAHAAKGDVASAETEQRAFAAAKAKVPESSILFNNTSLSILGVAEAMLDGEIEYRRGNFDRAFALLEEAVRRDDALNYDEPWGWMQPARHALGALLLEQGRVRRAETVFREDLRRHPNNLWSLHGLAECQRRAGDREHAATEALLASASDRADITVRASCYCRLGAME